jgi:hypothetical protein
VTVLILIYWLLRLNNWPRSRWGSDRAPAPFFTVVSFVIGLLLWLLPTAFVVGGIGEYFGSAYGQFTGMARPIHIDVASTMTFDAFTHRIEGFVVWIARTIGPTDLESSTFGLVIIGIYVGLCWFSPNQSTARPYLVALLAYLLMLFALLPAENQRYFLPIACVVGWALSGAMALLQRAVALQVLAALAFYVASLMPSLTLVPQLRQSPPVLAIEWLNQTGKPGLLYSSQLYRHAQAYPIEWTLLPAGTNKIQCTEFFKARDNGKLIYSTKHNLCGEFGNLIKTFKRDRRVHFKHHQISFFSYN